MYYEAVLRIRHVDADPDPAFHFDADPNLTFQFDADPDPAFHIDSDPDPASQNDAGPIRIKVRLQYPYLPLYSTSTLPS